MPRSSRDGETRHLLFLKVMKYILGYSRDNKGGLKNRHLNTICNALCVARRANTEIYVFEATEMESDRDNDIHTNTAAGELPSSEQKWGDIPFSAQPRTN